MSEQNIERRNWIGVSLLVIGVAFLYRNFEFYFFDIPELFYSWKFLLVAIGVILLLFGNRSGIPVLLVGLFFIFSHEILGVFRQLDSWWPVILIVVGIAMLVRSRSYQREGK